MLLKSPEAIASRCFWPPLRLWIGRLAMPLQSHLLEGLIDDRRAQRAVSSGRWKASLLPQLGVS